MKRALLACLLLLAAVAPPGRAESYTLRRGDTLYSVSRKFRVPLDDLLRANNITDPSGLKVGTRIEIPEAYGEYRAQKGDTLYSIARRFDVTVTELRKINSFPADRVLKAGDVLRVPEAAWEQDAAKEAASATAPQAHAPQAPSPQQPGAPPFWPHPGGAAAARRSRQASRARFMSSRPYLDCSAAACLK